MGNKASAAAEEEEENQSNHSASVSNATSGVKRSVLEVVNLMFPVYFVDEPVSGDG